jgi:hypothetical protein
MLNKKRKISEETMNPTRIRTAERGSRTCRWFIQME